VIAVLAAAIISVVLGHEAVTYRRFVDSFAGMNALLENALPSLEHLAQMRSEFRELREETASLQGSPPPDPMALSRRVERTLRAADAQLEAYKRQPAFPGERGKQDALEQAIARVRAECEALVAAASDPAAAEALRAERLAPALNDADRHAEDLVELNARLGREAALGVVRKQESARRVSTVLLAAVLVAIAVAALLAERRLARRERAAVLRMEDLDAFASRVAHDLKGSLGPTLLVLSAIRREPGVTERTLAQLDRLERSIGRTTALLDGLLDFSRAGARSAVGAKASVAEAVRDALALLRPLAEEARVSLVQRLEPDLEVATTPAVLASVVQNLLRNGIVHMGASTERVVTLRAAREPGELVSIQVEDTGQGMPEELLRRIFQPFQRAPASGPGHGLGLAIVRRLVTAHGGTVRARSRVGAGSVFEVRLPVPRADGSRGRRRALARISWSLSRA
jgi:signal transduction histidine kinase